MLRTPLTNRQTPQGLVSRKWWTLLFLNICKFAYFKNPFAMINSLSESAVCLSIDSENLFSWYYQKNWFLWTMAAAEAAETNGDEWGLNWYLQLGTYTLIPIWTHSQNLLALDTLSLKTSSCGTSPKLSKTILTSKRTVISYVMKESILWESQSGIQVGNLTSERGHLRL